MSCRPSFDPSGARPGEDDAAAGTVREARFMVQVDGRPGCSGLIRATCRMAEARGAPWIGVHLDGPRPLISSRAEERRLSDNLLLTEELGADLIRLSPRSRNEARELLTLARTHQVTHLVLGRGEPSWRTRLAGSVLEDLSQGDLELIIHVVPTRPSAAPPAPAPVRPEALDLGNLGIAIGFVALATGVGFLVFHYLGLADVIMLYMLCITAAATQFGRWPTLIASVLSILALDFCFIEPRYTFVLTDIQHIGTFAMMLGVGWVILGLAERIRAQTRLAQNQERHTRTLYRLGKALAEGGSVAAIQQRVVSFLRQELDLPVALLLCDAKGRLPVPVGPGLRLEPQELELARAVMERGVPVGHGTECFTESPCLMLPMPGTERPLGVMGLWFTAGDGAMPAGRLDLLIPLASQIALALERASLAEDRTEARIQAEHEQLRSTLLSSISHDLRTPLGTITGATTALLNPGPQSAPGDPKVLLGTILQESRRLLRMVNNLLDITKLESGLVQAKKEWAAIEEVVGSALGHLEEQLGARPVSVELPEIWVPMDPVLMEQALINLLDNAIKFSPPGSAIEVRGWVEGDRFRLSVADDGPGLPPGEEELIFEKLYRGTGRPVTPGAGLGLAICKGIAQAHGGTIMARTRPQGGAQIVIALPLDGISPELNPDFHS
jgi:two-component system sensor histidine kinase KdpD